MSIVASREQRRQLARDNARLPEALTEVPREAWPPKAQNDARQRVLRSRDFLVQVFHEDSPLVLCRLSVNRTTLTGDRWAQQVTWDELQRLKAECGYGFHDAVEIYPDERHVVNVANMRHLWVLREPIPYKWR